MVPQVILCWPPKLNSVRMKKKHVYFYGSAAPSPTHLMLLILKPKSCGNGLKKHNCTSYWSQQRRRWNKTVEDDVAAQNRVQNWRECLIHSRPAPMKGKAEKVEQLKSLTISMSLKQSKLIQPVTQSDGFFTTIVFLSRIPHRDLLEPAARKQLFRSITRSPNCRSRIDHYYLGIQFQKGF